MANKRMFSKDIVSSRAFLEMPPSARALYYQLGVEADDDGFIDPYVVMLITKATDDDLKIILAKKFCIRFENGVVVVTHWKRHNTIKPDRYTPTIYQEEKKTLSEDNKIYIPYRNVSGLETRLGKVSLDKVSKNKIYKKDNGDTEYDLDKRTGSMEDVRDTLRSKGILKN